MARIHEGLSLVDIIARQLRRQLGSSVMVDELVSFGREGLLSAARSFDPTLGVPFRRWANYRVRGAMLDGVRQNSALPRSVYRKLRGVTAAHHAAEGAAEDGSAAPVASAEEADAKLGAYLAGIATAVAIGVLTAPPDSTSGETVDTAPRADDVIAQEELLSAVRDALATLPEQERHLIQKHYFEDARLDDASREIGLSKSWGSRLHSRAIESIARTLKRAGTTRR
jgi:RNA polymerase sigma factor for flagellar operon FliA